MTGIMAAFSSVWVLVMMASTVNARVINKRAAFYIANDTMCIVDGELYFNGDPVPTDDHCEKCTCRPPGFSCVLRDCEVKAGCKAVRKDGECCPDYICGCAHNGNIYKDGDYIRDLQNPCYTCRCHGSSISCTFADCLFRSDCGPEYIQGECCPRYDHCPPLSTTQQTTTVITTLPITYDETTKPLFNLTSPPHERLATHTTIFPTTVTVTTAGGEAHTTESYVKPAVSVVSAEATEITHVHDTTVTSSSESSTSRVTQAHTSTVTTSDSKSVTEMTSEVYGDSTRKPVSLIDEILPTMTVSTDGTSVSTDGTFSTADVKTDTEAKELTSTPIINKLSSEGDSFSEELREGETTASATKVSQDRQTTESVTAVSYDSQTTESVTEVSYDSQTTESVTEVLHDSQTTESVTEISHDSKTTESVTEVSHDSKTTESAIEVSHDSQTDVPITAVSHNDRTDHLVNEISLDEKEDESETEQPSSSLAEEELPSSSHTTELVTEVSHDSQAAETTEELSHDSKTEHTLLKSDGTVSATFTFSEEVSKASVDVLTKEESKDVAQSVNDILEITTDMPTAHQELKLSSEDEVSSTHGALPSQPEVEGSEGTSSSEITVTMSGDTDTEVSPAKALTTTETHETESDVAVSETFTIDVQGTTTQGTDEYVVTSETLLSAVTLHGDPQTESEMKDKTIFSVSEHSDSGDFSTIQSETTSHSFSTGSMDDDGNDDDSTDEAHTDVEISTQDAEDLSLFTGAVTPSDESQESSTAHDHITHLPSGEATQTQAITNEFIEEQSSNPTERTEDNLHTEQTETIDNNGGDAGIYVHSIPHEQGATFAQSTEAPHPPQHTQFVSHGNDTTTEKSISDISDYLKNESAINGNGNNKGIEEFLDSFFTEDITESISDISHSETDHPPDQVHPLNEVVAEENAPVAGTVESSSEHHEDPQLFSESSNSLSPADDPIAEGEQIDTETTSSSQQSAILTTVGTTEAVITMEAESDLLLTTSEDSSTSSSADDLTTASVSSESSELLATVPDSLTTTHSAGASGTLTPSPEVSSFGVHESTAEYTAEDDLSTEPKGNESASEKSHITSTVHPEQSTSDINKNSDVTLSATEVVSNHLDDSEHGTDISSIVKETEEHVTSESSISVSSYYTSPTTATIRVTFPEESNGGGRNDISSTAAFAQSEATSLKQITGEPKPTNTYDETENAAPLADNFNTIQEQTDRQSKSTSVTEVTTNSQGNIGIYITENDTEITMDAEESIVDNGFESVTDPPHITENVESYFTAVSKEDSDTQDHFTMDGETHNATNGEHLRTSRSTSSNSMSSSITVKYPENSESQSRHASETLNENTGASVTTGISIASFDTTLMGNDENESVTTSLHTEIKSTNNQNTAESTHSTYVNSAEASSLSFESFDDLSSNTEDSYQSKVTKLITYEADAKSKVEKTGETSEEEPQQEVLLTSTVENFPRVEPTADLLKVNNIAPDLIIPVEHQVDAVPFNSVGTEKTIVLDHSTDVTKEQIANPSTTLTPTVNNLSTSDLESSETENEDSSRGYDKINAFERQYDEDVGDFHFSHTSDRYAINEADGDNEISASTTEHQPTISSYTMDAEVETTYLDDSTENNKESTEDPSETSIFESQGDPTLPHFYPEEVKLIDKELQSGPEKGGEWFEPTISDLSAVKVHTETEHTWTSAGFSTSSMHPTFADMQEEITQKNEETPSPLGELVDQTRKSLDSDYVHTSTLAREEQHDKLTTTSSHVQDFTNKSDEEETDTISTNGIQRSSSESSGTTYYHATDDGRQDTNFLKYIYTSIPDVELKTNVPITDKPQENDAGTVVSAEFTFIRDDESSSSEDENGATTSEVKEFDEQETEEGKLPEQQSDANIQPSTTATNSISRTDEKKSHEIGEDAHRDALKNDELKEVQDTKEELISSQREQENIGSKTTKEFDISVNDIMLSDGVGNMMGFTDVSTDGADFVTGHSSTTEHEAVNEDAGEIHSDAEQVTNDQKRYLKDSSEENNSQESITVSLNTDGLTELRRFEDSTTAGRVHFEKNTENVASLIYHTEGLLHKNEDDHSTEQFSTSYYKSTTPLPLLLFNGLTEKVKEDSLVNQNSEPSEEQYSTVQPQEINEVLSELISDSKIKEDVEKQSQDDPEITAFNDHPIGTTTQRNSNEHDSVSATSTSSYEEKQTETYSASSQSEEFTSHSYSTENSHRDSSQDESEKVSEATTNSQVTEQNFKPKKHVPRVFVIRISHDYPSDETRPQKKEEHVVEKATESYSVKSPETVVDGLNETEQERNEVPVTTEKVVTPQIEEKTDNTLNNTVKNLYRNELDGSPTSKSSTEPTSPGDRTVQDDTTNGSSSDKNFNSPSTEVPQDNEEELLRNTHDDASELKKTSDYVYGDTA